MALGTDALGEGHQFGDALVAVVVVEVAEVGKRAAVGAAHLFDHAGQPLAVARQAAVVLDDHVEVHLAGKLGEPGQAVGGELLLLLERALAGGVDPDRVAAQSLGRLGPGVVIFDGLGAGLGFGVAEVAQAVAHDQQVLHAGIGRPAGQVGEVVGVLGLVLEELVDVLDCRDAELLAAAAGSRGCRACRRRASCGATTAASEIRNSGGWAGGGVLAGTGGADRGQAAGRERRDEKIPPGRDERSGHAAPRDAGGIGNQVAIVPSARGLTGKPTARPHPGGQPSWRPPSRCTWRWSTDWPPSRPQLTTSR